jgi:hypothetical protein
MNLKLKFQLSTPINLDINDQIISLVDIKPHFMTKDFTLSISALLEVDDIWKYDGINFSLSNENLKSGNCSLDFNADTAVFTIDAVFTLNPKSKFTSLVKNPDTKWAFGGIYISNGISSFGHDISVSPERFDDLTAPNNFSIIFGGSIKQFSYERRLKLSNGEEKVKTFHPRYHLLNTEVI